MGRHTHITNALQDLKGTLQHLLLVFYVLKLSLMRYNLHITKPPVKVYNLMGHEGTGPWVEHNEITYFLPKPFITIPLCLTLMLLLKSGLLFFSFYLFRYFPGV